MSARISLSADIEFAVSLPSENGADAASLTGVLQGQDSDLELSVGDLPLLGDLGARRNVTAATLAYTLAEQGVRLRVSDSGGPVLTVGAVSTGWLQRLLTGSPHIRVHRLRALLIRRRLRTRAADRGQALSVGELLPPLPSPSVLPPAPAFLHPRRRSVTTTHDPSGGGDPRLIFSVGPHPHPGDEPRIFYLRNDVTTIGSHASADLCLPGLAPRHAEIRHDENDEFVLVRRVTADNEQEPDTTVLRTGSRIELGQWRMSYYRAEYADHGRPYGGRPGGELGHQRPQPPRQRPPGPPVPRNPGDSAGD